MEHDMTVRADEINIFQSRSPGTLGHRPIVMGDDKVFTNVPIYFFKMYSTANRSYIWPGILMSYSYNCFRII
ncbi:MAG: hypothetical protein A2V67_05315 [Deltaproteobacteria bacterium RBG_13_61_14]|nr:MAG: hypothetical protein A2V67_05315 [Deltaproteobacteria bacterium RBG_13_61_14]